MKSTSDKETLQCIGLNAVMLMGGYGVCGRIIAKDVASYILIWLAGIAIVVLIWVLYTFLPSPKISLDESKTVFPIFAAAYMLTAAGLYLNGFIMLWQQWALPNTSRLLLSASAALVTVYGGSRGIRPVLRLCLPVGFALLVLFLLDTALLLPEMTIDRIRMANDAVFDIKAFLWLTLSLLLPIPAMIIVQNPKKYEHRSYCLCGVLIGLVYLLLSVLRSVMVLGPLTVLEPYPLLRALMLVYAGPGLGRMEAGGIMALSAAMLAAAMAFASSAFSLLPFLGRKMTAKVAIFFVLAAIGIF